jgi:hypothetical protein
VPTEGSSSEVATLLAGKAELALISDVFRIAPDTGIRIVAPLELEALHLLVAPELAEAATDSLFALEGHSVDLGPRDSANAELAGAVLDFAELRRADAAGNRGVRVSNLDVAELESRVAGADRNALPDAIFQLATVPSLVARDLIRNHDYRLVPLPFAEALRLSATIASDGKRHLDPTDPRRLVADVVLPPFLYQTKPAVPAAPLATIGARLHLVAREQVAPETVEVVLRAAFDSNFAHLMHPALERKLLANLPRAELHPGTVDFLERGDPAITNQTFDELSNTLSIGGALFGGGAFLMQGWRQRRRAARDAVIADTLLRVVDLERRVVEIELSSAIELDDLIAIQRELLQVKSETLDRFARGEIDGSTTLADLLVPIRALRDHVGELLLHVRDSLETQARAEGRTAGAVWDEAAEKTNDSAGG